jgi:hypothetical protein
MARFYLLDVQPDLFGQWCFIREWGRIGRSGQLRNAPYPTEGEAHAARARSAVPRNTGDICSIRRIRRIEIRRDLDRAHQSLSAPENKLIQTLIVSKNPFSNFQ